MKYNRKLKSPNCFELWNVFHVFGTIFGQCEFPKYRTNCWSFGPAKTVVLLDRCCFCWSRAPVHQAISKTALTRFSNACFCTKYIHHCKVLGCFLFFTISQSQSIFCGKAVPISFVTRRHSPVRPRLGVMITIKLKQEIPYLKLTVILSR